MFSRTVNDLSIYFVHELNKVSLLDYKKFKYGGDSSFLKKFDSFLDCVDLEFLKSADFVFPVERSFHCSKLGALVSRRIVVPMVYCLSQNKKFKQATLSRSERFLNVRDSFSYQGDFDFNSRVILFDDVCSTGSTLYNGFNCLVNHGFRAENIILLAFFNMGFMGKI